jgi:hypothetical protein
MVSKRATPASLRAWGRDYDGSPIAEGGDPMPGFTVGHLYDAANRIEVLEKAAGTMLAVLRKVDATKTPTTLLRCEIIRAIAIAEYDGITAEET